MTEAGGYLIDANVISELRRNKPHGGVIAWLNATAALRLFVSAFSIVELQAGVERVEIAIQPGPSRSTAGSTGSARHGSMLPMDAVVCRQWARETKGKSDTLFEDAWLVATARIHRLTIMTRNSKDFEEFRIATRNPFLYRGE